MAPRALHAEKRCSLCDQVRPAQTSYRKAMTVRQKVDRILAVLQQEYRMSGAGFIRSFVTAEAERGGQHSAQTRADQTIEALFGGEDEQTARFIERASRSVAAPSLTPLFVAQMRREQVQLRDEVDILGSWDGLMPLEGMDWMIAARACEAKAPVLWKTLASLARNQHTRDEVGVDHSMQILMVVGILNVCSSLHSNAMQRVLGLYVKGDNGKRRMISVLHKLGIVEGWSSLANVQASVVSDARARLPGLRINIFSSD